MVNSRVRHLDDVFFALSDPTRRAMVARLAQRPCTVAELARPFDLSAPAISKHLRVLERAGLVRQRRQGRTRQCRLTPEPLRGVAAWVDKYRGFWNSQLDQLAEYLEKTKEDDKP